MSTTMEYNNVNACVQDKVDKHYTTKEYNKVNTLVQDKVDEYYAVKEYSKVNAWVQDKVDEHDSAKEYNKVNTLVQDKVDEHYAAKEYNKVCLALLGFLSQLSATHLHLSKDRLAQIITGVYIKLNTMLIVRSWGEWLL